MGLRRWRCVDETSALDLWKSLVCDGLVEKIAPTSHRVLSVSSRAKIFRVLKMAEINGLGVSIGILENRVGGDVEEREIDTGEKLWGRYMVGTRVAIRFVPSFSREGVIPYPTMRLGASLASVTSLVLKLIPKAGHSRRPSLFGWDCSFPLVDIGL